jgi:hypothetical protein
MTVGPVFLAAAGPLFPVPPPAKLLGRIIINPLIAASVFHHHKHEQ